MGLTVNSVGSGALDHGLHIRKTDPHDLIVALAGNPNVGKSTVFNALTHGNQHTGNWPGKTVASAQGVATWHGRRHVIVDLPGTYSLMAHSAEEEVARDFICFGNPDCTVVVVDATCLERNLNLVLQTIEITPRTVVCVNLMDEAEKKHIRLDLTQLEQLLGVPVVPCAARAGRGLDALMQAVCDVADGVYACTPHPIRYVREIERAASSLAPSLPLCGGLNPRWLALRVLENAPGFLPTLQAQFAVEFPQDMLATAHTLLFENGMDSDTLRDRLVAGLVLRAEEIACDVVQEAPSAVLARDRKIDRILTSRRTGIPIMLLLLAAVFFLTITGANYPSALLNHLLFSLNAPFTSALQAVNAPVWLQSMLIDGVWTVLAWAISTIRIAINASP